MNEVITRTKHKEAGTGAEVAALILVVDDDSVSRHTITKVLEKSGYGIREAASGKEAIQCFGKDKIDLVLLDVVMPVMDGYETCRQLRQLANDTVLPIIMLTGLDAPESVDLAFDAGATDFINKPLNWTLLVQRVRYGLRARSMTLELISKRTQLAYAQRVARLGYWEYLPDDDVFVCSDEVQNLLGVDSLEPPTSLNDFLSYVSRVDRRIVEDKMQQCISRSLSYGIDHMMRTADGREIVVHHQAQLQLQDTGHPARLVGTLQDISERKRAEEKIQYQAFYDELTSLPNRRLFLDRLTHAVLLADKVHWPLAVVVIGVDRLKIINESLGHEMGDELLKSIARKLSKFCGAGYTLGRTEGDVFGLLLEEIPSESAVDELVKGILALSEEAHVYGQHEMFATLSIGIMVREANGGTAEVVMKSATTAMHRAKENGGNQCRYFEAEMNVHANMRLLLVNALRKALEHKELELHFQPQLDFRNQKIVGAEALLRWRNTEYGNVSPVDFIPLAEETGLIIDIGQWVLNEACKELERLRGMGYGDFRMGVNFSAKQFRHGAVVEQIKDALQHYEITPYNLELEITESIALYDFDVTVKTLNCLKEIGVQSSIDDFGTGFCSLSYLHRLPVSALKIDRTFVKDINERGERGEIARAIIAMAHSLGLAVIAEGVETDAQYAYLRTLGCDDVQGYLIAEPMSAQHLEQFLGSYTFHS